MWTCGPLKLAAAAGAGGEAGRPAERLFTRPRSGTAMAKVSGRAGHIANNSVLLGPTSGDCSVRRPCWNSMASASFSGRPSHSYADRRSDRTHICGNAAICRASSSAATCACPSGTTRFASPGTHASSMLSSPELADFAQAVAPHIQAAAYQCGGPRRL